MNMTVSNLKAESAKPASLWRWLQQDWLDRFVNDQVFDFFAGQLSPMLSRRRILARVESVQREARGVKSFVLQPNGNWTGFQAGQHVNVTVEIDGVRHTRTYSPSSSDNGLGEVVLTVKRIEGGKVSNWMHDLLRAGDVVELSQPFGDFVLPGEAAREKMLLIGGGSGMTPLMSMIRTLADRNALSDVVLIQYAPSYLDLLFADELTELAERHPGFHVHFSLTRTPAFEEDLTGHFSAEQVNQVVSDIAGRETWVCGPQTLIDAVSCFWQERSLEIPLHTESFTPPALLATDDAEVQVRIEARRSVRSFDASSTIPLLFQAESAGLNPPSGCRQGICMSCTCRKHSGIVQDMISGEISSEPDVDIRLCISRPLSDVTLDI